MFSHEEPVHLEKLSVNRPLTQKAGSTEKTLTIGSGALDALVPSSPSHCAVTRTNCTYRPLTQKLFGGFGFVMLKLALW